MEQLSRRHFLAAAALTAASAAPDSRKANQPEGFSFLLLGDTHFDRLEHHDLAWMRQHYAKDIVQVEGYVRKTTDILPGLFQAARRQGIAGKPPAAMVIHAGDVIEGLCGSGELAERQCREFFEFYEAQKPALPFFSTKGNHDITGPGAAEAFDAHFLARFAAQLDRPIASANYTVERGNALFAFFDAYAPDSLEWLTGVLGQRSADHLFLVVHPPVVPYNARAAWALYSHPRQAERRQRLLQLLGRHRAIVLSGHLHKYSVLVRRTPHGNIVQLGLSSVVDRLDGPPPEMLEGVDAYGPRLVNLEPNFNPPTKADREALLAAEKPSIGYFEYSQAAGFAMVRVAGKRVVVEVHQGGSTEPWRTVDLSALADW